MNPAELIVELAADLEEQHPPPGSPAATFVSGVRSWLSEGGSTLDQALNLVSGGPGKDSARTLYLRKQRDFHLRQAHQLCEGSPWARSVTLAGEIRRYLGAIEPRWRDLDSPPPTASQLRTHLFFARKSGELPTSVRQVHLICTGF